MLQLTWFPLRGFSVIFEIVRHLHHLLERELMYQTVFCTGATGKSTIHMDSDKALRPYTSRHPRVVCTTGIRLCCLFSEHAFNGRVRPTFMLNVSGPESCVNSVAFVYAPLAPLVALIAAVAFFASAFVFKFQLLYVYVTKYESGGRMWRMLINRYVLLRPCESIADVLTEHWSLLSSCSSSSA